jgi:RNA polymerase sigma-70 factor (ECF subfamily)
MIETEPPVHVAPNPENHMNELRNELLAFLRYRVPNHYEEIAQDTWLRIARAQPVCPDDRSFRAYTFAVARRLIIDHYRRDQSRPTLVALDRTLPVPGSEDPHSSLCAAEVIKIVDAELKSMKPEIANVFRWRMTEDISFREIAERQNISINTALGRMHSATKRLAEALKNKGWDQGDTK